ncbi:unnamed protein product [Blepharisma stoltei]|uniref:Uncharacterized protein n=1 Tax=Blepharisma stoltei TaxID=1481888 RepID=A0AAU9JC70_9CILI|nr:unnamed protein product [Blepharisma stoltei]
MKNYRRRQRMNFWDGPSNIKTRVLWLDYFALYFYKDLRYKILENAAARYFINTFKLSGPESISFSEKESGLQLGRRITIAVSPSESKKYFIKTQRYGALDDYSTRSQLKELDPKEAFIYYLLYQLNIGPKVHFFWEDKISFYIATEDLNERGSFNEYSKLYEKFLDPAKTALEDIPQEYFHICDELLKLDLISRILCLTDTTINKENFGFLEINGEVSLFLIDFYVKKDSFYMDERVFLDFLKPFCPSSADPTSRFALAKRSQIDRAKVAANFLNSVNILQAIETSWENVSYIFRALDMNTNDLSNYIVGIKMNFQYIKEGLIMMLESMNKFIFDKED